MTYNVLHLLGSFHQGGSERQALQLARLEQESARCRVHLACLDPAGVLRAEAESIVGGAGMPAFPLTSFRDRNFLRQLRRCAATLREREIDIVQTHDFYTNVFGMAAATLARVPVRVAAKRETGGMRTPSQERVERWAFKLAHAVCANSAAVRRMLSAAGVPDQKIVVIHNGLDVRRLELPPDWRRADALAALGLPRDETRRYVTLLANLRHAVKDHPTFLRAARRVRAACPDAAFVLAGEGELRESLGALASELGLADSVFFTGRCERVADLLAVSEVCVLSSQSEGFANVILEYMAAVRPVVATDVGGAREVVSAGETGYLVPAGDDEGMGARILELLRDAEGAREMGRRGRSVVERDFSCRAQLEHTLALYDRLTAERGGRKSAGQFETAAGVEREPRAREIAR
jgi:glycosyltransferase involved in cell wall biosynthesis